MSVNYKCCKFPVSATEVQKKWKWYRDSYVRRNKEQGKSGDGSEDKKPRWKF